MHSNSALFQYVNFRWDILDDLPLYIYMYMCVCVCVRERERNYLPFPLNRDSDVKHTAYPIARTRVVRGAPAQDTCEALIPSKCTKKRKERKKERKKERDCYDCPKKLLRLNPILTSLSGQGCCSSLIPLPSPLSPFPSPVGSLDSMYNESTFENIPF